MTKSRLICTLFACGICVAGVLAVGSPAQAQNVGYQINVAALKQTFGIPLTTFAEWIKTVDWEIR